MLREVVDSVNRNLLHAWMFSARARAEVIVLGDNFSSSVQPPRFFREWSAGFYAEAFRRNLRRRQSSAVHVDGLLKGLLSEFSRLGCDAIDAVTPAPMGDLTPRPVPRGSGAADDSLGWCAANRLA